MRLFTVAIMLVSVLVSMADEADSVAAPPRYIQSLGVRGTFDVNIPGRWTSTDRNAVDTDNFGYGVAAGVVYNVMRDRHWYLESGLQFSYNDFGINMLDESHVIKARITKYDIILPLTIGYQFDLFDKVRMNVMTGFEGTVCMGGSIDNYDCPLFGSDGVWRRGDLKWGLGAGFVWDEVSINIMSYFGLINQLKRPDLATTSVINDNVVRISLTYHYRL